MSWGIGVRVNGNIKGHKRKRMIKSGRVFGMVGIYLSSFK